MSEINIYLRLLGPFELIGIAGFICYIFAFGSVQFGFLDGNSAMYSLANIAAAVMVSISLVFEFNLSSALIQGSWIVIGVTGLILRARNTWITSRHSQASSIDGQAI